MRPPDGPPPARAARQALWQAARGWTVGTSAGRAGLLHAGLTLLAALTILGVVYGATALYERRAIEDAVRAEATALARLAAPPGDLATLAAEVERLTLSQRADRSIYILADPGGRHLAGGRPLGQLREGSQTIALSRGEHAGEQAYGVGLRVPGGGLLVVARDNTQIEDLEEIIVRAIVIAGGLAVLLSLAGGIVLGRSVSRRAVAVRVALADVAEGNLARRLPSREDGDEFDRLAGAVNTTLERLQAAVSGLRQVTGDIAHDLRTPLARMRQKLDRAVRAAGDGPVPREVVERAMADIDQVLRIFEALLRIAQIEAGERRASFETFDLSAALMDVGEALSPAAEDAGRPFVLDIEPGLRVRGDRALLQQAFVNLVENALRHTPAGTPVRLSLARDGGTAMATVRDQGAGIPEADRDRVLRPFVRLDESRTTHGTGLGLALVKAVADLHGARLTLVDARPGLSVGLALDLGAGM